MAEGRVTITINGHNYPLACNPGEEEHIKALAAQLDKTAQQIAGGNSSINESRLLVMVGLIFADRINELENKNAAGLSQNPAATLEIGEKQIVTSIESITKRIERLASKIKPD
ncbi:MAG: cell division protein ZapA [Alphaproteobacteria bacterium]|nr:cell division protein ZapA [Alphaproteobacteria bacterium]